MIKLNPYPYLIGLMLLGCLYAGHRGIVAYEVKTAVAANTIKIESAYKDKLLVAADKADKKEGELIADTISLAKEKDAKITVLNIKLNDAVSELRKRPKRPSPEDINKTPLPTTPCTGATLYSEDGEFLAREAARADKIIIERNYYYAQYEQARKKLEEYADSE